MATTTSSNISSSTNKFQKLIDGYLVGVYHPKIVFAKMAKKAMADGSGTYSWIKPNRLALDADDLVTTEGVQKAATTYTFGTVSVEPEQLSMVIELTDVVMKKLPNPVAIARDVADQISKQMGRAIDQRIQEAIVADTSIVTYYGGDATSNATLAVGDRLTSLLIAKAETQIRSTDEESELYAVIHPKMEFDIKTDAGSGFTFLETRKYTEKADDSEIGKIGDVRIYKSTNVKPTATNGGSGGDLTVYTSYVLAKDAVGIGEWDGLKVSVVDSADSANVNKQKTYFGAKVFFGTTILRSESIVKINTITSHG